MASYIIMRSCGHEEKVFVEGGYKQNEWRLERMKQEPCSECAKKIRDEENARNAEEPEEPEEPEDKLAAILESDREAIEDLKDE